MNLNWPSTEENDMVPWYVILARLPGYSLILAGHVVTTVGVLLYTGSVLEAQDHWVNGLP